MVRIYAFAFCSIINICIIAQESKYLSIQKKYQSCKTESALHSKYLDHKSSLKDSTDIFLNLMAYANETRKYNPNRAFKLIQDADISLINKSNFERGIYSITLGSISIISENPTMAIKHYKSALQNFKQTDSKYYKASSIMSLGRAYTALGDLDSGRVFFHKAQQLVSIDFPDLSLKIQLNQAVNRKLAKDYNQAERLFKKSLSMNYNSMEDYVFCRTQANLAEIYTLTNQFNKADSLYSLALSLAIKNNLRADQYRIHNELSILHQKQGDYKKGLIHRNLADSIRKHSELISISDQMAKLDKKFEIDILAQKTELKEKLLFTEKKMNTYLFTILSFLCILLFVVIYQMIKLRRKNTILINNRKKSSQKKKTPPISESDNKITVLLKKLDSIQRDESIILDNSLTMDKLAKKLNTNRTYLSEAINLGYQISFSKWINQIRINKACDLLLDSSNDKFSLDTIANMVGFTSISSFNTNFKKITGITPSYFRNHRDD
jgi:AraC-like DNA-binding protein